ncbi:MAG: glycosyltransferase family 39 protein, partial [Anaerolineales bacterium]
GAHALYFPANNGREPLFIYLVALSVGAFGRTPFAERLPAALVGALTVPAAYALGRALFNQRVGLMGAALVAFTFWPIALSRIGFRAGTLPLVATLSLVCAIYGWRRRNAWLVALGGALYGLTFYTYLAARFTPLALFAFLIFWYIARRDSFPTALWPFVAFVAPAALVAAPLAGLMLAQPDIALGRAEQVSIFSQSVNGGDLWGTLFHNLLAAPGMFVFRGDALARHNLPGRPIFDPLIGTAFLVGVGLGLRWVWTRRDLACALALIWVGVMLLPTALAADAPHFLRAVGVMPMAFFFPALALDALWTVNLPGRWPALHRALAVVLIAVSLILTGRDYFARYLGDPDTRFFFQSAATDLAAQTNTYLGAAHERRVYLDKRLWDSFPSLRFLLNDDDRLRVFGPGEVLTPGLASEVRVVVWPYEDPRPALAALPVGALIRAEAGPLYRGDEEPEPYSLF